MNLSETLSKADLSKRDVSKPDFFYVETEKTELMCAFCHVDKWRGLEGYDQKVVGAVGDSFKGLSIAMIFLICSVIF